MSSTRIASQSLIAAAEPSSRRIGGRTIAYVLAATALACLTMLTHLGSDRLETDEAHYAAAVENIRTSGDWVHVTPTPPAPYFQKPPLYMWLTALTYDRVPGLELKFRIWSALFGVASVAMTCIVGAMLLSPEIGLLGALLLATNGRFLVLHGARTGNFDTALTFFVAVSVLLYWLIFTGRLRWSAWVGIGLAAGLSCLLKPLAGMPILILLAIHAIAIDRGAPMRRKLFGIAIALVLCLLVAAPWHVAMWHRYGREFIDGMFRSNIVDRAMIGVSQRHLHGPLFYLGEISMSSLAFALFIPAMIFAAIRALRAGVEKRREWGMLMLIGAGWVIFFSVSRSKFLHYTYPAFPFIAIAIAGTIVAAAEAAASALKKPMFATATYGAILVVLLIDCCWLGFRDTPEKHHNYVPWNAYQTLSPALARGDADVVFVGFPTEQSAWRPKAGLDPTDFYYLCRMQPSSKISDAALLVDAPARRPTLAIFSKRRPYRAALDALREAHRTDSRFDWESDALVVAAIDCDQILRPALKWNAETFEGTFAATIAPTIREDAWVGITLKLDPTIGPVKITAVVDFAGHSLGKIVFSNNGEANQLGAHIRKTNWRRSGPGKFTIRFLPLQTKGGTVPIRGRVTEMRLTFYPALRD